MGEPRVRIQATMNLSIIIVNWNTENLLKNCLLSLQEDGSLHKEVWVVDNASDDGSVRMIQKEFPQVKLILNKANTGFAYANNQALAQSTGRYCLLLNPDTVVPAGTLDKLVRFMEGTPEAGIVGCAQIYPDGQRQVTCHRTITLMREMCVAFGLAGVFRKIIDHEGGDLSQPIRVDWTEGGALLIRRSVLSTIGLMDDAFFMYVEDADLCFRVWQANWGVYYMPNAQIIHYRGQSTGFEQREQRRLRVNGKLLVALHRSKAYFIRKHYGAWQGKIYRLLVRVYGLRKLCMGLMFYMLRMMGREMWDNFSKAYLSLLKADLES